jgi:hypothetical protein
LASAQPSGGLMTKKAGWNCYGADCEKTAKDGPLYRTEPKGEPGRFMCLTCATAQKQHRQMAMDTLKGWVFTA